MGLGKRRAKCLGDIREKERGREGDHIEESFHMHPDSRGKVKSLFGTTSLCPLYAGLSVKVLFLVVNCSFLPFQVLRA